MVVMVYLRVCVNQKIKINNQYFTYFFHCSNCVDVVVVVIVVGVVMMLPKVRLQGVV